MVIAKEYRSIYRERIDDGRTADKAVDAMSNMIASVIKADEDNRKIASYIMGTVEDALKQTKGLLPADAKDIGDWIRKSLNSGIMNAVKYMMKMQDIKSMIEEPDKPKKELAKRIVCEPVVNIDGEKRAFVKEMEKVRKRYEKRIEALRDLQLPEIK